MTTSTIGQFMTMRDDSAKLALRQNTHAKSKSADFYAMMIPQMPIEKNAALNSIQSMPKHNILSLIHQQNAGNQIDDEMMMVVDAGEQQDTSISVGIVETGMEKFREFRGLQFTDTAMFHDRSETQLDSNSELTGFPHDENFVYWEGIVENYFTFVPQQYSISNRGLHQGGDGFDMAMDQSNSDDSNIATMTRLGTTIPVVTANENHAAFSAQTIINDALSSPFDELNMVNIGELSSFDMDGDNAAFYTTFKTATIASNPIMMIPSAGQPHPATQMVAVSLIRNASVKGAEGENISYRLKLNPPELGRLNVEIKFEADHKIHAHLMVDKPETLQLLQRDSHILLKALQDAGFDSVSNDSLSFNLSQGQNDPAGHDDSDRGNGQNAHLSDSKSKIHADMDILETQMTMIMDPVTGQQRINMVV